MAVYTLYLYDSQDFDGGLPRESNGRASGGSRQCLTFGDNASGQTILIDDNDDSFDEIDRSGQTLAEPVTCGGRTYPAGTKVWTAYDLQNSSSGHRVTTVHFGGSGYQQGSVHGCVSTEILEPGQTYNFNVNRTSHGSSNPYEADYVPCLVAGTEVLTPDGPCPVDRLERGQLVVTRDNGAQPIRHIWSHTCHGLGKAAPVVIPKGALGDHDRVSLSAEHRVMLSPAQADEICGWTKEAFIAAKFLDGRYGVVRQEQERVSYWHMLFDRHEVIEAGGLPVESYLWTVKPSEPFGAPSAAELAGLLPADRLAASWVPARPIIRRRHIAPAVPAARPSRAAAGP